jgi:hypothetical protein
MRGALRENSRTLKNDYLLTFYKCVIDVIDDTKIHVYLLLIIYYII